MGLGLTLFSVATASVYGTPPVSHSMHLLNLVVVVDRAWATSSEGGSAACSCTLRSDHDAVSDVTSR